MLCTSGFVDDVTFSHNGSYGVWYSQYLRERRPAAISPEFPTYSPGCTTLFDFVVVHNDSRLQTGGVSDDDMWPLISGVQRTA